MMEIIFKNGSKIVAVETTEDNIRGNIRGYIEIPEFKNKSISKIKLFVKNLLKRIKNIWTKIN